ncbi:MAG: hypothetical protein WDA37_12920 [Dysgonamonadaceae bacterium]
MTFGMLAHHYKGQNVAGWFCSRKFNGWRCLWDGGITTNLSLSLVPWYEGKSKELSTGLWTLGRYSGPKPIFAPRYIIEQLPRGIPLDGELWHNTDNISIVKSIAGQKYEKSVQDKRWQNLQYMVFNIKPHCLWSIPEQTNHSVLDFQGTINFLKSANIESPFITLAEQKRLSCTEELPDLISYFGGEGVMLSNPYARYELKRSSNLLKVKKMYETEGQIVRHVEGKGKHSGRLGSIIATLTWDEKVESVYGGSKDLINKKVYFGVGGFSDEERDWDYVSEHFPIGGSISFSYLGVTPDGIPVSANLYKE